MDVYRRLTKIVERKYTAEVSPVCLSRITLSMMHLWTFVSNNINCITVPVNVKMLSLALVMTLIS